MIINKFGMLGFDLVIIIIFKKIVTDYHFITIFCLFFGNKTYKTHQLKIIFAKRSVSPSDVFISAHDPDAPINIRRCECGIQSLPLKRFIHSVDADFDLHSTPQSSGPDVFWQLLRGFLTNCIKHADWYQKVNTEEIYIKSYCQGPSVLLGGPAALALSLARCLSVSDVVRWRILSSPLSDTPDSRSSIGSPVINHSGFSTCS